MPYSWSFWLTLWTISACDEKRCDKTYSLSLVAWLVGTLTFAMMNYAARGIQEKLNQMQLRVQCNETGSMGITDGEG